MTIIRWLIFIPLGAVLGFIFALPSILVLNISNLDNIFFTSIVKNGFSTFFMILCMAWIVPKSLGVTGLKTLVSILYGIVIALTSRALLTTPEAKGIEGWEYAGEVIGLTLGYLSATVWDKHSLKNLLQNEKGVMPYNAYKEINHSIDP